MQEVVLEVPRKLIEDWKRVNPELEMTDDAIAADIARVVVADAISSSSGSSGVRSGCPDVA